MKMCHYVLTSSIQLQNTSIHDVKRMRTTAKRAKMKHFNWHERIRYLEKKVPF